MDSLLNVADQAVKKYENQTNSPAVASIAEPTHLGDMPRWNAQWNISQLSKSKGFAPDMIEITPKPGSNKNPDELAALGSPKPGADKKLETFASASTRLGVQTTPGMSMAPAPPTGFPG